MTSTVTPAITFRREKIDHRQAQDMLAKMPVNRKLSAARVDQYARAMEQGDWDENEGSPLRFDVNGNLIDGQHRLNALIKAQKSFTFFVIRGLSPEAIQLFDTGKSRTLVDFLQMRGESNANEISGMVHLLMSYEATGVLYRSGLEGRKKPTVPEALRFFDERPGMRDAAAQGRRLRNAVGGGGSRWGAIHYVLSNIDADDADYFLTRILRGDDLDKGNPILQIRERVLDDFRAVRKLREVEYTALVLKAWNLFREGRRVVQLAWHGGGRNPEPYPEPK